MAKLTRSGVAHDLTISPHLSIVNYGKGDELTFVFSSELYVKKFETKLEENRDKINNSLSQRFGFDIKLDKLADIKLYEKTETRGFLILGKEEYKCLNTIKLDGKNLILTS